MRKPFDATLTMQKITVATDSIGAMTSDQIDTLVEIFNTYGISVVQSANVTLPDSDLLSMSALFGQVAPHKLANKFGIYDIRSIDEKKPSYPGTTWKEHPLHTDGAFQRIPERIGCLQCVKPAEFGGASTLASGNLIYQKALEELSSKDLMGLFDHDAIYIERDGQRTTSSIFFHFDQGVGMRYRRDEYADIQVSEKAKPGYQFICGLLDDPGNILQFVLKPRMILIFDNYGVLHGRTAFAPTDFRHYKRMNCVGNGRLSQQIQCGIYASSA